MSRRTNTNAIRAVPSERARACRGLCTYIHALPVRAATMGTSCGLADCEHNPVCYIRSCVAPLARDSPAEAQINSFIGVQLTSVVPPSLYTCE